MITVKGNLLDTPIQFIAHQVNCCGVMGAGVAKALAQKYPNLLPEYRDFIECNDEQSLGMCCIYHCRQDNKYILNIFGQLDYGRDKCYTDYDAVATGFYDALEIIHCEFYKEDGCQTVIAIPYGMGCGLAGGNWAVMTNILERIEKEKNVLFVAYKLEE